MSTARITAQYAAMMLLILLLLTNTSYANDPVLKHNGTSLGVMGETYPILEMDFLDFIESRIDQMHKSGQWKSLQAHSIKSAITYRDRPPRIDGVSRATVTKSWTYDPTIVLDHDVVTPDGKLIAIEGARINPLEFITIKKTLIFYDGDDETQVKWVAGQDKKLHGKDKLILVNGSVLNQEKQFKKPIYFDQAGKLTSRFGITHVPAVVKQEGAKLRIMETRP